jgi:hypothetical protein
MAQRPNPPDRDDPVTERAVSTDTRPAEPQAGAGRAINAAFSRHYPPASEPDARGGLQDTRIEGAGYPSEDMDDVDPEDEDDEDLDDDDADEEDGDEEEGYQLEPADLETNERALEEMMTPPGGDDLGGDRDTDPNLNGGHGIRMQAPEEGPIPIEVEPTDTSIIGHGHEDKAAWNRDRVAHLQEMEDDEREVRDATSEDAGLGGAALAGVLQGWEGGVASRTLDQGDDAFDRELSEEEEVLGDMAIEDLPEDVERDDSIEDPNNTPFLPEHRDLPDDNLSLEEKLIATPGEDILSSGPEIGVNEELEMEDLNQTDSISRTYEDQREFLDDAMDGNERRDGFADKR